MGNERLTALTLLHIHRDIEVDVPQVVDEFAKAHEAQQHSSRLVVTV